MRHRDERQFLQDILECIERIESYISDERSFASDSLVQDAVTRNLEIIGEAATHLSQETKEALPEVAWKDAIDMRNFLIHAYLIMDLEVVWRTVELDLPKLKDASVFSVRQEVLSAQTDDKLGLPLENGHDCPGAGGQPLANSIR